MKVRLKLRLRSWFEAQLEGAAPLASSPPRFETAASHVSEVLCAQPTSPRLARLRASRSHFGDILTSKVTGLAGPFWALAQPRDHRRLLPVRP